MVTLAMVTSGREMGPLSQLIVHQQEVLSVTLRSCLRENMYTDVMRNGVSARIQHVLNGMPDESLAPMNPKAAYAS